MSELFFQEQIFSKEFFKDATVCSFTGHRELNEDFSVEKLENAVDVCIENGVKIFCCGMARGFDLTAGETVIKKKREKDVKLVAVLPFFEHGKNFSAPERKRYDFVLENADEIVYTGEKYFPWCFQKRDDELVSRADVMIAYLKKSTGGTAYTVKKFLSKKHGYVFYL